MRLAGTGRPVDGENIAGSPIQQMGQTVPLGRRQGVFVARMSESFGKQSIGWGARFVRAALTLGEALERVVCSRPLREELGQKALAKARRVFSLEAVAARRIQLYEQLLSAKQ